MKCLIIGNLTLDKISETNILRIGGPGLYGGLALYMLGCETHVVTSMNQKYRKMFRELDDKIIIHEYSCDSIPLFIIKEGRAYGLETYGCRIEQDYIEDVIKSVKPDILLFSPVYNEIDISQLKNYRGKFKAVSLDIQGLTRKLVNNQLRNIWDQKIFGIMDFFDIIHGNIREMCFASDIKEILRKLKMISFNTLTALQVSMDEKGLYLLYNGEILYFPPIKTNVHDDVGAGDILLAVTSYYLAIGYNIAKATQYGLAAVLLKISSKDSKWFNEEKIRDKMSEIRYIVFNL